MLLRNPGGEPKPGGSVRECIRGITPEDLAQLTWGSVRSHHDAEDLAEAKAFSIVAALVF